MKKLQTEIIINASAEKVWNILTDFEKFPQWNPFLLGIEGKAEVGNRLTVTLKNGKGSMVMKPKVLVVEPNKDFEWLGILLMPGIFNGQHRFYIEPVSANQVKFVHSEQFTGILAGLLLRMIGEQTLQGFIDMNKALKERAEKA